MGSVVYGSLCRYNMRYMLGRILNRRVILSVLLGLVAGLVLLTITVSAYSLYTQVANGSGDLSVADDCSTAPCDVHGCRLDKGESWCESTQQCHEAGKYCPPSGGQPTPTPTPSPTPTPTPKPGTCNSGDATGVAKSVCEGSYCGSGYTAIFYGDSDGNGYACCHCEKNSDPVVTQPPTDTGGGNQCATGSASACVGQKEGYEVPGVCSCQKTPGTNVCACVGLGNRGTGESCSSNTNCSSGDCDDTLRVCRPAAGSVAKDGTCVDNSDCKSGLVCNNHRCSVADSGSDSLAKTVKTPLICDADLGVCFNEGSEDVAAAIYKNTKTIPSGKDVKDLTSLARNPGKSGSVRFDTIHPAQEDPNLIEYGQPCLNGNSYFPPGTFCYLHRAICASVNSTDQSVTYCLAPDSLEYVQVGGVCILDSAGDECAGGIGVCSLEGDRNVCRLKGNESIDLRFLTGDQRCTGEALGQQCAQETEQGIYSCQSRLEGNLAIVRCLPVTGTDGNTASSLAEVNRNRNYGEACVTPSAVGNDSCAGGEGDCVQYRVSGITGLVCMPRDDSQQFDYYSTEEVHTEPGILCTGTNASRWWCGQNGGVCRVIQSSSTQGSLEGVSVCANKITEIFNQAYIAIGSLCDDRFRGGDAYLCDHGAGVCTVDPTTQRFECKSR